MTGTVTAAAVAPTWKLEQNLWIWNSILPESSELVAEPEKKNWQGAGQNDSGTPWLVSTFFEVVAKLIKKGHNLTKILFEKL